MKLQDQAREHVKRPTVNFVTGVLINQLADAIDKHEDDRKQFLELIDKLRGQIDALEAENARLKGRINELERTNVRAAAKRFLENERICPKCGSRGEMFTPDLDWCPTCKHQWPGT